MRRRFFIGLMVIVVLAGVVWAGGRTENQASQGKVSLRVQNWGNLDEGKIYDAAIARFQATHPNVAVENTMTPVVSWANYVDKWVTEIAGGNAPDVINIAIEGARLAVSKDLLIPLNKYSSSSSRAQSLFKDIPKALLDAFTVNGNLYLMPNGWQTMLIAYNTKMFKENGLNPPGANWTWQDFLQTAQKLTTGSGDNKIYGYAQQIEFFHIQPWFITNGTSLITSDYAKPNLKDTRVIEAAQFLYDLKGKYGVMPDPAGLDVYSQFAAGKIAMIGAGRWPIVPWRQAGFKDFDYAPWPRKAAGGSVFGTAGWGISPKSAQKDLSWELITELLSQKTLQPIMDLGQQITPLASLSTSPTFLQAPPLHAKLLWDAINDAKPVAAPPWFLNLEPTVVRAMQDVFSGSKSAPDVFNAAQMSIENSLK